MRAQPPYARCELYLNSAWYLVLNVFYIEYFVLNTTEKKFKHKTFADTLHKNSDNTVENTPFGLFRVHGTLS